jgi:serine protease AprX
VAVIDSGIAGSNDLSRSASDARSRVISGYDFTTAQATYQQNDACGHGTCVAGIIGGNAYNSSGLLCFKKFSGLAPEANILNLRVLGAEGNGDVGNVLAAIDWCIQRRTSLNIRVMNLSLGHAPGESYRTDPLCQAAERAWKAGILVVCAAGNSGRKDPNNASGGVAYGTIHSPGNDPYVLTVGATNDLKTAKIGDDTVATYSSRGPSRLDYVLKPDILAPGNKIISLRDKGGLLDKTLAPANVIGLAYYLKSLLGLGGGTSEYFEFSGTSMAAPVVSGAAALMLQKDPTLTPNDLKARLMKSAIKVWRTDRTTADIYSRGAGYLNIPRALQCTARVTSPALSPYCTRDGNRVTVHTEQAIWADQAVWSDQAIWADRKVDGDQAIWSDQAIWADQAVWSDQAIWADQAIWSDQAIWADISKVAIDGDR